MDPLVLTVVMRALERLLAIGAGALSIYLGFRLFLAMPGGDPGSGKVTLPGGISIYLSRVGPGAFFSLFGTIVIALSFHFGVAISGLPAEPNREIPGISASPGHVSYIGAGPSRHVEDDATGRDTERVTIERTIRDLNRIPDLLRPDLSEREQDALRALEDAKVRLMREVWDSRVWGDFSDFQTWLIEGGAKRHPETIAAAVRVYQAGAVSETGE